MPGTLTYQSSCTTLLNKPACQIDIHRLLTQQNFQNIVHNKLYLLAFWLTASFSKTMS